MASNIPINTAVIGYGLSAKVFHIPFVLALPALYKLYGIVQRSPTPTNDARKDHPETKVWSSASEVFADPNVHLVIISSIPTTHFDFCKQALESGKHVICEKPFTPTSSEAEELAALAKQNGKVLAVYQNRRWDADYLSLQKLVADGTLGRIAELETHFDRHRPEPPTAGSTWKIEAMPASGAIYDLGTHLLDQILNLFGAPSRVTAFIGNQRIYAQAGTGEDAGGDSFTIFLHYDDPVRHQGLLVTAKAGVVSPEAAQLRFWARGEKGSWRKYHLDIQEDQLRQGMRPLDSEYGIEPEGHNGTLTLAESGGSFNAQRYLPESPPITYLAYFQRVADAIHGDAPNPVPAEEAAMVIRLIERCQESSTTGKTIAWA